MSAKTEAQLQKEIRVLRRSLNECRRLAASWAWFYAGQQLSPGSDIHPAHQAILDRAKAALEES